MTSLKIPTILSTTSGPGGSPLLNNNIRYLEVAITPTAATTAAAAGPTITFMLNEIQVA